MAKTKRHPFYLVKTKTGQKSMKKICKVKTNIFWFGCTERLDTKAQMSSLTDNIEALAGVGKWKCRFLRTTLTKLVSNGSKTNPETTGAFTRHGILSLPQNVKIDKILAMFDKDDDAWACDCPYSFEEAYSSLTRCISDYDSHNYENSE